jgi:hypothetical protein
MASGLVAHRAAKSAKGVVGRNVQRATNGEMDTFPSCSRRTVSAGLAQVMTSALN